MLCAVGEAAGADAKRGKSGSFLRREGGTRRASEPGDCGLRAADGPRSRIAKTRARETRPQHPGDRVLCAFGRGRRRRLRLLARRRIERPFFFGGSGPGEPIRHGPGADGEHRAGREQPTSLRRRARRGRARAHERERETSGADHGGGGGQGGIHGLDHGAHARRRPDRQGLLPGWTGGSGGGCALRARCAPDRCPDPPGGSHCRQGPVPDRSDEARLFAQRHARQDECGLDPQSAERPDGRSARRGEPARRPGRARQSAGAAQLLHHHLAGGGPRRHRPPARRQRHSHRRYERHARHREPDPADLCEFLPAAELVLEPAEREWARRRAGPGDRAGKRRLGGRQGRRDRQFGRIRPRGTSA